MQLEIHVGKTSQSTSGEHPVLKAILDLVAKDGLRNSDSTNGTLLACYSKLGGNNLQQIHATLDKAYRDRGRF